MTFSQIAATVRDEQQRMLLAGCCFADARYYDDDSTESLTYYDGNLESNAASGERGIGVRVLYQGAWGFAATADLSTITACYDRALSNAQASSHLRGFPRDTGPAQRVTGSYRSPVVRDPFDVPLQEKLALLRDVDAALRAPHVAHRTVSAIFQRRHVYYWNTDGTAFERRQINTFGSLQATAPDADGRQQLRSYELCGNGHGTRGFEWLADGSQFADHAQRVKAELALLLEAETLPPGRRDVILLPGQGFLQVHETIGHALELDRILGYELSYAGGSHVKPEMIGSLRYGSEKLNCQAGVTENSPGTFGFDDDGLPQRDYPLISKGVLVDVISSRTDLAEANAAAGRTVVERSGTASRCSAFYRPPIDRMTNINILPGADGSLEEIIADTEDGIVLDMPTSWSIGSNREHFHFGCEIAWEIKNGTRTRIFKNPTYQGHTLEFWNALDMVGDERTWRLQQVNNCGKGEPNQVMEVGHGVPVMRFRNVETGEKE